MSSAFSERSAMLPRENAIGNMTDSAAITRPPAGDHLGLAERRVRQAEKVANLVHRDRLEIECDR